MLWACLATGAVLRRRGSGDAWAGCLPRGIQIIAASFEGRTAIAGATTLEALAARFKAKLMASP